MSWLAKARPGAVTTATRAPATKPGPVASAGSSAHLRVSNGLKELLWLIGDIPHARILDLGPVWQSTVSFFVDKGFRVSSEDMLRTWKDFLTTEEEQLKRAPADDQAERVSQSMLADKFLESALQYPESSFHAILVWDLLEYFDPEAVVRLMERISAALHPGGALLALFHSRPVEQFSRYRIVDGQTIELVANPVIAAHTHVFHNREILELFGQFRSSKTFVGRDQVREALFLK